MCRELIHIYGPFSICSYGVMVLVGILLFSYLINRDRSFRSLMTYNQYMDVLIAGALAGLFGGRLLFILSNWYALHHWYEFFAVWDGGLSLLGSMIGILLLLPWYLNYLNISILPFFDLIAVYIPLLHGVARIGCLLSGCCYGSQTDCPWGIVYHSLSSDAPFGVCIHPVQLYSSFLLVLIFIFMRYFARGRWQRPGQLMLIYLLLVSAERFIIDFWRADREYFIADHIHWLSLHQYIALCLGIITIVGLIAIKKQASPKKSYGSF